ncbi:intraflagellar transport protein 74 homolog [Ornithodoros turicata]|uniref:intraflagellar transport protein 74 homolog n=1 Tax=Ornithodoros turicata TaxID=34597 RepID=UPI003139E562
MTMDNRPPTSAALRPVSGLRSSTASTQRSGISGTASRLMTAASTRPGTRSGNAAQGISALSPIAVAERPITQHGLVAPKTAMSASRASQRHIQDKSYFVALLRNKMTELTNEIARLQRETESQMQEQTTYVAYEKKAETLAAELKQLQGEMADYNLLMDKLNTDAEMDEVREEYRELQMQNDHEARSIELLFEQRQEKESQLKHLEEEIEQERHMADSLVSAMKPELRSRYADLKNTNQALLGELEKLQHQLSSLHLQKQNLDEDIALSQVKQEAVSLYERLRELEEKKAVLQEEERSRGSPAEERERLLKQVKEDNAELASIEHQAAEIQEHIAAAQEELSHVDQELEEQHGERRAKYRELRKREETMDAFLGSFDETKESEQKRQRQLQSAIVEHLENISRNLGHFTHLPSQQELSILKDDLAFKENEIERSKSTLDALGQEQKKLAVDLRKIEQLENKVQQELETLRTKISTMSEEMVTFSDLDKLKASIERKKQQLMVEKESLRRRTDATKTVVEEEQSTLDELQRKLSDNELLTKLTNLERRLQHQEQNNFTVREFIVSKMAEHNYKPIQLKVQAQVDAYNKILQDNLAKGTTYYG